MAILTDLLNKARLELDKAIKEQQAAKKKDTKIKPRLPEFPIPNNRKLEDVVEGLDILAQ